MQHQPHNNHIIMSRLTISDNIFIFAGCSCIEYEYNIMWFPQEKKITNRNVSVHSMCNCYTTYNLSSFFLHFFNRLNEENYQLQQQQQKTELFSIIFFELVEHIALKKLFLEIWIFLLLLVVGSVLLSGFYYNFSQFFFPPVFLYITLTIWIFIIYFFFGFIFNFIFNLF